MRKRKSLSKEEAMVVIERISHPKVGYLVRSLVEQGCLLVLHGEEKYCNVHDPTKGKNILGDISIYSKKVVSK
ncbi:hypothetical protein [Neobacillus vireti]|uniref:hypothetical protein n=1 Tax=Neobacillus vireti TaxID=220686 RepID=UPI002FFDD4F5